MKEIPIIIASQVGFPTLGSLVWQIPVLLLLVFANAFFVASEVAVRRLKYMHVEDIDGKAGAVIRRIMDNTDRYLFVAQFGITVATVILGALATRWVGAWLEPYNGQVIGGFSLEGWGLTGLALLVAVLLVSVVHVTLGEQVPKVIALRRPIAMARFTCVPLHYFAQVVYPFSWVLRRIGGLILRIGGIKRTSIDDEAPSADEIRTMVESTESSNEVTETERDILMNALELNDICARDIMTPRSEAVVLDVNANFEDNIALAIASKHTRFPLVDGHIDETQGIVHIKDMLPLIGIKNADLRTIMRSHLSVSEQLPLDETLKEFLNNRAHLAVVTDEFGGAAGIVTLDNVIEELVGDIQDEFDDEPEEVEFRRLDDGRFEVDGTFGLHELEDEVGMEFEDADVSTIGGYVVNYLGHLPEQGEALILGDYSVTVEGAEDGRVQKLVFAPDAKQKIAG